MIKSLCCDTPSRRVRIGWLSFQKNGDISFGLSDNTYIAPRFEAIVGIWNAYNRVKTTFEVVSDPSAAVQVVNPHLTWHAPNYFHLKSKGQRAQDLSFRGIADIPIMLHQDSEVQWIKATSGPVSGLKTATGSMRGRWESEALALNVPSEMASVQIKIDFVRPDATKGMGHFSQWYFAWHEAGIRLTMAFTYPHFPTLSWAHFH